MNVSSISRRDCLSRLLGGALTPLVPAVLGSRLPAMASAPGEPSPFLVIVNLRGGNDGINTLIPFRLAAYRAQRPTLQIPEAQSLSLATGPYPDANYHLHPALVGLAALWGQGGLAIVNRAGYPRPDLSHEASTDIWSRGVREPRTPADSGGWIARYRDRFAAAPLDVVGLGTGSLLDFQGGLVPPLLLASLDVGLGFGDDPSYAAGSRFRNAVVAEALDLHSSEGARGEVKAALLRARSHAERLNSVRTGYSSPVVYPQSGLASRLREAAMLVQAGLDTKLLYVQTGGYDTHSGQGPRHQQLLAQLDGALAAFAADLLQMGAWSRAIVVVISEFGRRNDENGSQGTDHGSSSCMFVLGGAVRGGLYGTAHSESDLGLNHTPYAVDFRLIYKEILGFHLDVDPAAILPEAFEGDQRYGVVL